MSLRKLHGQFMSTSYDTGLIVANASVSAVPGFPIVIEQPSAPYGVDRHNDRFVLSAIQENLAANISFATYQKVDLRDLFDDRECMDNIVVNVQRLLETPVPNFNINMGHNPLLESFYIINEDVDTSDGGALWNQLASGAAHAISFGSSVIDSYESVIFRETRRYVPDASQMFRHPLDIGSYIGATPGGVTNGNAAVYRFNISDRTVGGYPQLLCGPYLTVLRVWTLYGADRSDMAITGGGVGDAKATNYEFAEARAQYTMGALQWTITGNRRKMTDNEIATVYSNRLIVGS